MAEAACSQEKRGTSTMPRWQSLMPRALILLIYVVFVTVLHFSLSRSSHLLHGVHVLLAGAYLVPIVGVALWFKLRGAVITTLMITAIYLLHANLLFQQQPIEHVEQAATIAILWTVGIVSGVTAQMQERERAVRASIRCEAERVKVLESLAGLANALHARDPYTREHSERVSQLSAQLGRRLGLPAQRVEIARLAGLVHDIGKIGIHDDILLTERKLSAEQRRAIEDHPRIAADILKPIGGAAEIAEVVLAHHESPDGSGYPRGLRDSEIPLEAKIVKVADVFASLTERRPYKPALNESRALEMMSEMTGTKLDREATESFKQMIKNGAEGSILTAA